MTVPAVSLRLRKPGQPARPAQAGQPGSRSRRAFFAATAAGCLVAAVNQALQAAAAFPSLAWPHTMSAPRPWPMYAVAAGCYLGWALVAGRRSAR